MAAERNGARCKSVARWSPASADACQADERREPGGVEGQDGLLLAARRLTDLGRRPDYLLRQARLFELRLDACCRHAEIGVGYTAGQQARETPNQTPEVALVGLSDCQVREGVADDCVGALGRLLRPTSSPPRRFLATVSRQRRARRARIRDVVRNEDQPVVFGLRDEQVV